MAVIVTSLLLLLGGIDYCSASDSAYSYTFLRRLSVSLSSVVVCRLCTLLKPVNEFRYHLASTLIWWVPVTHCVRWGPWFPSEGEIWSRTLSQNMQLEIVAKLSVLCCHLENTNEERFRLLPNYFGPCHHHHHHHHHHWLSSCGCPNRPHDECCPSVCT